MENLMPIMILRDCIAECAARIAPTKSVELSEFCDDKGVSIDFTEDKKFRIRVDLRKNTIKLPIGALNYLWCATNLFLVLYRSYTSAQERGELVFDVAGNSATTAALDLFNWARNDLLVGSLIWPSDAAKPSLTNDEGDQVSLTNEIFLVALSWILHHERAHIELQHKGNSRGQESVMQEKDADRNASEWIMAGCTDKLERQKRAFGIATGILAMAMIDNPRLEIPEVSSHPPEMERLIENLEITQLDPDNIVYAYSLVVLQFCIGQYDQKQADMDTGLGESGMTFEKMFTELAFRYHTRHRN